MRARWMLARDETAWEDCRREAIDSIVASEFAAYLGKCVTKLCATTASHASSNIHDHYDADETAPRRDDIVQVVQARSI
jgi:hypothetical protein